MADGMRENPLTPIQQRLLEMLSEVVSLCDSNGITYYAAGGTALGAVRHGGFIPWDDDVDLMMPRDDWMRFVEFAKEGQLPRNRELCCLELDENYPHVFGRYVDITSCCVHYNQLLGGTPEGLCIDIFILDPVPDAGVGFDSHREALSLYNDVANEQGYSYPMSSDSGRIKEYSQRAKREGRRRVLRELEAEVARYDDGEYLVMRWACAPRLFHKSIFGFKRFLKFENLQISVPARLNDYLVQHYGDSWPCLPPEDKRVVHDAFSFADIGYREFQADYLPFIDVERTRRAILARRNYHVNHMDELHRAEDIEAKALAVFAREETVGRALEYERRIDFANVSNGAEGVTENARLTEEDSFRTSNLGSSCPLSTEWPALWRALRAGEHADLEFVFSEYYRIQGLPQLLGREEYLHIRRYYCPVVIDFDDELISLALLNLVDTGRLALAGRILAATERVRGALPLALQEVKNLVSAVRMPSSFADVELKDEARDFARFLPEELPNSLPAALAFLRFCAVGEDVDAQRYDSVLSHALELFPENGELLKLRADRLTETAVLDADLQTARELYITALEKTDNAFVTHEICDIMAQIGSCGEPSGKPGSNPGPGRITTQDSPKENREASRWPSLQLLDEIVSLCAQENVPCCLGPLACAYAFGANMNIGPDGPPELDILIPSGSLEVLARAIQSQDMPNRALDCWLTNPRHADGSICYVDSSTTFLNLDDGPDVMAPGFRVRIHAVMARRSDMPVKMIAALESGWKLNGYRMTKSISAKTMTQAALARATMVAGRKRAARNLFSLVDGSRQKHVPSLRGNMPVLGRKDSPKTVSIALSDGWKRCEYDALYPARALALFGSHYPGPANPALLLEAAYGRNWRSSSPTLANRNGKAMTSGRISYESLVRAFSAAGVDVRDLYALMRHIRLRMVPLANDLRTRNRAMLIARRSYDRKQWYDRLKALDAEIADCVERGDLQALAELLDGYRRESSRYLEKGLALCPSKHYLGILCSLLEAEGEAERASKLRKLAPQLHWDALE